MRISTAQYAQGGINLILQKQAELAQTQEQVSTQKKVNRPSDDPVAATQILRFSQEISLTTRYQENGKAAEGRINLVESTMSSVTALVQKVRELYVSVGNASLNDADRAGIAVELEQRQTELLGLANTQDANGEYLFAGFQSQTQPFVKTVTGAVRYQGDQGQRELQLGASVKIPTTDSGYDIFMDIRAGNGRFVTSPAATNVGTGLISAGEVLDPLVYNHDDYQISFVTNGLGKLAYRVDGATGGQILPPLPLDPVLDAVEYIPGAEINFGGISTVISGTPQPGDSFTANPSARQDIFGSIQSVIDKLRQPVLNQTDRAELGNLMIKGQSELDNSLDNILKTQAKTGARLNVIESQRLQNDSFLLVTKTSLSGVEDVDMVQIVSQLSQQSSALEAAQASYVRIQQLNLFKYL